MATVWGIPANRRYWLQINYIEDIYKNRKQKTLQVWTQSQSYLIFVIMVYRFVVPVVLVGVS